MQAATGTASSVTEQDGGRGRARAVAGAERGDPAAERDGDRKTAAFHTVMYSSGREAQPATASNFHSS